MLLLLINLFANFTIVFNYFITNMSHSTCARRSIETGRTFQRLYHMAGVRAAYRWQTVFLLEGVQLLCRIDDALSGAEAQKKMFFVCGFDRTKPVTTYHLSVTRGNSNVEKLYSSEYSIDSIIIISNNIKDVSDCQHAKTLNN